MNLLSHGSQFDPANYVLECFRQRGDSNYGKEAVSQLEHALQTAFAAEQSGASPQLVAACLLHDIGHMLHNLADNAPDNDIDDEHERLAAVWLADHFLPEVVEPVRLHVAAKRYLCFADSEYFAKLSPPSVQSLKLQGGPMNATQAAHFEAHPHFASAIELRRYDEIAKIPGLATPSLEHYEYHLRKSLLNSGSE